MRNSLLPFAKFILQNARTFDWSLQGLGMLRLYLPGDARLHVWDKRFAYPGASPIHDHTQWALESTIISGRMTNYRFAEVGRTSKDGAPYHWSKFKAGYGTQQLGEPETMMLIRREAEVYGPGDTYRQEPDEIHESCPDDGTVTFMQKYPTVDAETARIFWPAGTKWGSAEPRMATLHEINAICGYALEKMG